MCMVVCCHPFEGHGYRQIWSGSNDVDINFIYHYRVYATHFEKTY